MTRIEWQRLADCRTLEDPDLPFSDNPTVHRRLKLLCDSCPVLESCQPYSILHEEYGFYGALTEEERRRIRTQTNHLDKSLGQIALEQMKLGMLENHHLIPDKDFALYKNLSKPLAPRIPAPTLEEQEAFELLLESSFDFDFDYFPGSLSDV